MKYLLIIILSFLISSPVLAARSVEGTVPDLAPLQPAPENVFPNISNNIEYKGAPEELNSEEGSTGGSVNKDDISLQSQASKKNSRWVFWPVNGEGGSGGLVKNIAFFLFVIVVLGAGVYYFKRGK